jgi:hypothetical protein
MHPCVLVCTLNWSHDKGGLQNHCVSFGFVRVNRSVSVLNGGCTKLSMNFVLRDDRCVLFVCVIV